MITFWLGLLVGLLVGGSLGIVLMSLLAMAGQDEPEVRR